MDVETVGGTGSSTSTTNVVPAKTVMSVVETLISPDVIPEHPFSTDYEQSVATLRRIVDSTNQLIRVLHVHNGQYYTNPKILSLLRQQSAIAHTVHTSDQTIQQTVDILRKRVGITYGEDIPLDRPELVNWSILRFEQWGASAGMEAFREEESEGRITMMLGGKVIVIDIDIAVDRSDQANPKLEVVNVKTSYAVPNGSAGPTTAGSLSLDGFLADSLRGFVTQVQKDEELQDPIEVGRIGSRIADHLKYLMYLDKLALSEGDTGLRWFNCMDELSVQAENFAIKEADVVKSSLSAETAPLDVFLMRAHSLPLPYLLSPSISFLVHLSPQAYLSSLRAGPSKPTISSQNTVLPNFDVSFHYLRPKVAENPTPPGVTIATLIFSPSETGCPPPEDPSMEALATRPTFTLAPEGSQISFVFPLTSDQGPGSYRWYLDFTGNGKHSGVVMSQSRMHEIEMVISPSSSMSHLGDVSIAFGNRSWLDLLLQPQHPIPTEQYTSIYTSPKALHPPLLLRLTSPDETGFHLQRVPVRSMREVWGVLEVVREQCWLNEILLGHHWIPVGPNGEQASNDISDDVEATEAELNALLSGTLPPERIPVNVYLPTSSIHDPIFDTTDLDSMDTAQSSHSTSKIVMTVPERLPITGVVSITVAHDTTRPRGVGLQISGALGADLDTDMLEEVCRRGGTLGLPGRVWAKAYTSKMF